MLAGGVVHERPQRLESDACVAARRRHRQVHASSARFVEQPPVLGVVPIIAAGPQGTNRESRQDAMEPAEVIRVRVRQRDQLEVRDALAAQEGLDHARAGIERAVVGAATVDQDRLSPGHLDDSGISLPHVEERDDQIGIAPARQLSDAEAEHGPDQTQAGRPELPPPARRPARQRRQDEERREDQRRRLEGIRRARQPDRRGLTEALSDRQRQPRAPGGHQQQASAAGVGAQRRQARARQAAGHDHHLDQRNQQQISQRRCRRQLAERVRHDGGSRRPRRQRGGTQSRHGGQGPPRAR